MEIILFRFLWTRNMNQLIQGSNFEIRIHEYVSQHPLTRGEESINQSAKFLLNSSSYPLTKILGSTYSVSLINGKNVFNYKITC